jgi:hypothetical protein
MISSLELERNLNDKPKIKHIPINRVKQNIMYKCSNTSK